MADLVEQVARAICREAGYNPDARVYGNGAFHFVWEKYKPHAEAATDMTLEEAAKMADYRLKQLLKYGGSPLSTEKYMAEYIADDIRAMKDKPDDH